MKYLTKNVFSIALAGTPFCACLCLVHWGPHWLSRMAPWPFAIPLSSYIQFMNSYWVCCTVLSGLFAVPVILQIAHGRWRRIRVFVSYHLADHSVALQLAAALRKHDILADVYYCASATHDDIVDAVTKRLRQADAMLVLPGTTASFVDAEILAASVAKRTVTMIAVENVDTLPNTAYSGYPVFIYSELQKRNFVPLAEYLRFVHSDFVSFTELVLERHLCFGLLAMIYFVPFVVIGILLKLCGAVGFIAGMNGWRPGLPLASVTGLLELMLGTCTFLLAWAWAAFSRRRAVAVARQSIVSGVATKEILEESLPVMWKVSECMRLLPLSPRHSA